MIVRILYFVIAQAAALGGAAALLRLVRTGDRDTDFLQFLLLRLLLISLMIMVSGVLGVLNGTTLGGLSALSLVILLCVGAYRGLLPLKFPRVPLLFWCIGVLVALRLVAQVWYFAPHIGDAVAYHLPKVAEWVQNGAFTREMGVHPHATFPAGFELIETWWVIFLHHDVLIETAGVEFVLLAGTAVYVLAHRIGLEVPQALLAGLIYVLTPGFHLSSTSCLNDAPVAAMVLSIFALVASRATWPMVVIAVSLGIGIKPTVGFALPGVILLAWLTRREGRHKTRVGWILACVATVVGLYWYARNLLWFGNPFYPLGSAGFNPVAVQFGPSPLALASNLNDLLSHRLLDPARLGANVDFSAGWGGPAIALGLVGLISRIRTEHLLTQLTIASLVSLLATLLFVQHDPWSLKYVLFFPGLLAISAAHWARNSKARMVLTYVAIAVSLAGTTLPYDLPSASLGKLAMQPVASRSALTLWADDVPDEVVGCKGDYRTRSYLLYRPDFSRRVQYLRGTNDSLLHHVYAVGTVVPGYVQVGRHLYRKNH